MPEPAALSAFAPRNYEIDILGTIWWSQSTSPKSFSVSKPAGNTSWPLTVDSGTIYCRWKELIRDSDYRHAKRPLVLFDAGGSVYGVNGAASGVGGYTPIERIMVEKRLWQYGASAVIGEWIQAGLALCDGNNAKAQEAMERANAKAAKPLPKQVEVIPKKDTASVNKRRIFVETVRCEDRAIEESFKGHNERFDKLIRSGRRQEAIELNKQRLEKENQLMASCKSVLREREGLSVELHKKIVMEGISRGWATE